MSLFQTTQNLINTISKAKPGYEVKSDYIYYSHPEYAKNGPYAKLISNMREGEKRECYVIQTDTLISIIKDLFGNKWSRYHEMENLNTTFVDQDLEMEVYLDTIAQRLIIKYLVDLDENNQSWWDRSQEEVLNDLNERIKENYKL